MTGVWPTKVLFYFGIDYEADRQHALCTQALSLMEGVCGLLFYELDSPDGANLYVTDGPIDGPGNVVADTQEPTPGIAPTSVLVALFDIADFAESDQLTLTKYAHEFGHAVGRDHSPPGVRSVMSATLDESIDVSRDGLPAYDEAELQAMYGLPAGVDSSNEQTVIPTAQAASQPTKVPMTPAGALSPAFHLLQNVLDFLDHLPGVARENVSLPALVKVIEDGLAANKDRAAIVEDIIAAASLIFPASAYAQFAVRLLGYGLKVYSESHAAAA